MDGKGRELTEAWGEWLGKWPWQLWSTLTFKQEQSHNSATRAFRNFAQWLQKDSPSAGWFCAHEIGDYGRLHLHALLGGLGPHVSVNMLWRWWFDRYGRAQLLPYDPTRGAAFYISKYVVKGDLSHYEIEEPRAPRRFLGESGGGVAWVHHQGGAARRPRDGAEDRRDRPVPPPERELAVQLHLTPLPPPASEAQGAEGQSASAGGE